MKIPVFVPLVIMGILLLGACTRASELSPEQKIIGDFFGPQMTKVDFGDGLIDRFHAWSKQQFLDYVQREKPRAVSLKVMDRGSLVVLEFRFDRKQNDPSFTNLVYVFGFKFDAGGTLESARYLGGSATLEALPKTR